MTTRVPDDVRRLNGKLIYVPFGDLRPVRLLAMRVENAMRNFMNQEKGAAEQARYLNLIAAGEKVSEPTPRPEKLEDQKPSDNTVCLSEVAV